MKVLVGNKWMEASDALKKTVESIKLELTPKLKKKTYGLAIGHKHIRERQPKWRPSK